VDFDVFRLFHTVRLFGGNLAQLAWANFIAHREKLHQTYGPASEAREMDHGWQPFRNLTAKLVLTHAFRTLAPPSPPPPHPFPFPLPPPLLKPPFEPQGRAFAVVSGAFDWRRTRVASLTDSICGAGRVPIA